MTKQNDTSFKGFTPETIQFFRDIEANNNKEWFDENKPVFEKVVQAPFKELILALTPTMHTIDSQFELRPHRVLSRIYRDVRFSKNKDPYKTCLWMSFQHPTKEWENLPGYFMELSAQGCMYGMGLYCPKKKTMDELRDNILYNAEEFRLKTEPILGQGFEVRGEEYKRPIKSDLPHYYQQWIQRKGVYVSKLMPLSEDLFGAKLANMLISDYTQLAWLYDLMKNI